jgi:hypothetical protein
MPSLERGSLPFPWPENASGAVAAAVLKLPSYLLEEGVLAADEAAFPMGGKQATDQDGKGLIVLFQNGLMYVGRGGLQFPCAYDKMTGFWVGRRILSRRYILKVWDPAGVFEFKGISVRMANNISAVLLLKGCTPHSGLFW